jgi:hypothetical protein
MQKEEAIAQVKMRCSGQPAPGSDQTSAMMSFPSGSGRIKVLRLFPRSYS